MRIKLKDHKYSLEGDFEFFLSPLAFDSRDLEPSRRVSFWFNPEIPQDLEALMSMKAEDVAELVSEKLKQDFKKAMINNSFTHLREI